jgi:16S rRNA processing protein RimM
VPGERWIALGVVARPHGVRGEVRVHPFNPGSTLLLERSVLWMRREGGEPARVSVESGRPQGDVLVLRLGGIGTREAAEALRGVELCVPRDELPALPTDEAYHADLIGRRVRTADGADAGEIVDVLAYPSADCLLVRAADGDREVPCVTPYLVELGPDAVVVAHLEDLDLILRKPG